MLSSVIIRGAGLFLNILVDPEGSCPIKSGFKRESASMSHSKGHERIKYFHFNLEADDRTCEMFSDPWRRFAIHTNLMCCNAMM